MSSRDLAHSAMAWISRFDGDDRSHVHRPGAPEVHLHDAVPLEEEVGAGDVAVEQCYGEVGIVQIGQATEIVGAEVVGRVGAKALKRFGVHRGEVGEVIPRRSDFDARTPRAAP